jgi:hypothetical protein
LRDLHPDFTARDVRSRVDLANFRLFVGAINGGSPNITPDNGSDLDALCKGLKFIEFGTAITDFFANQSPSHSDVVTPDLPAAIAAQNAMI